MLLFPQVVKGGTNFLESSIKGINAPKAELEGDGVRQYIAATKAGDQMLGIPPNHRQLRT